MTDAELGAIEAREAAATEGPWVTEPCAGGPTAGLNVEGPQIHVYNESSVNDEDADFIAHARTDVPTLVAEVRRLRAELVKAEEDFDRHMQGCW